MVGSNFYLFFMDLNDFDNDYKKKIALANLAAGKTLKCACEKSGLTTNTVSKLKNSKIGKKLLKQAAVQIYEAAIAELSLGCMDAVHQLREIINDSEVLAKTKISAIQVMLQYAEKARELLLEERLEDIEEQLDESLEIEAQTT